MVTVLFPDSNETSINPNSEKVSYIIDGGHLLHRVVWRRPATFKQICEQYTNYIISHYGPATAIFDGYHQGNTKDEENLRRSRSTTNIEVKEEDSIHANINQSEFLAN
ncbi:hypothetical protein JTE90_024764 [Oedothorax gibbosus]|uniref:Uncharacterized protein n=1 Tax=Oedothorax gibbosus TaxID=931172 RepID=A0AAV6UBK9_9ARAC|nr:hypothetical protein JTE90_024764 [Oedothorax gibbosus]